MISRFHLFIFTIPFLLLGCASGQVSPERLEARALLKEIIERKNSAINNRENFPVREVVIDQTKTWIWKVEEQGYDYAVVKTGMRSILMIYKFNVNDSIPEVEDFTGCKVVPGAIPPGSLAYMDMWKYRALLLDCP